MYSDVCPDGATDEQHLVMLAETGQCPWCGLVGDPDPDLYELLLRSLQD